MKIFNVGPLELVFIVLIAFIVLGPKKAVKMAGDLGRWIHKLIKSPIWQDFKSASEDINNIPREVMGNVDIQQELEEMERAAIGANPSADRPIHKINQENHRSFDTPHEEES